MRPILIIVITNEEVQTRRLRGRQLAHPQGTRTQLLGSTHHAGLWHLRQGEAGQIQRQGGSLCIEDNEKAGNPVAKPADAPALLEVGAAVDKPSEHRGPVTND